MTPCSVIMLLLQGVKRTSSLQAPIIRLEGHKGEVFTCKFSTDGDLFASAGLDRSVWLWRAFDTECENFSVLTGHKNAILELQWSADSRRIVTASPDKTVRAWDVAMGKQVKKMSEHSDTVNSCHLLRKGSPLLVSGAEDGLIKVANPSLADSMSISVPSKIVPPEHVVSQVSFWHAANHDSVRRAANV